MMTKLTITTATGRLEVWTLNSVRKLIVVAFVLGVAIGVVVGLFVGVWL
jgi:hypothetical protein